MPTDNLVVALDILTWQYVVGKYQIYKVFAVAVKQAK